MQVAHLTKMSAQTQKNTSIDCYFESEQFWRPILTWQWSCGVNTICQKFFKPEQVFLSYLWGWSAKLSQVDYVELDDHENNMVDVQP